MLHAPGINEETILHDKYNKLTHMSNKYVSKIVCTQLISNVSKSTNLREKWSHHITDGQIISNKCFTLIYSVTIDNILSFQYKLLHRILFFNNKFYVFNMVNSNMYDSCNNHVDSLEPRIWFRTNTKLLWEQIIEWHNQQFDVHVSITYFDVISNM